MTQTVAITSLDRFWQSFRSLVLAELPTYTFHGAYEYVVQAVHGSVPNCTVDCTPTDTSVPLPALSNIAMRSAADGGTGQPTPGNRCLVMFVNADPSRPVIVGTDANCQNVSLDASGSLRLGASSSSVGIGPLPEALAHSAATVAALNALESITPFLSALTAAIDTLTTAMAANTLPGPAPPASTFTTFAAAVIGPAGAVSTAGAALIGACTTATAALAVAEALIPTTVVTGQ